MSTTSSVMALCHFRSLPKLAVGALVTFIMLSPAWGAPAPDGNNVLRIVFVDVEGNIFRRWPLRPYSVASQALFLPLVQQAVYLADKFQELKRVPLLRRGGNTVAGNVRCLSCIPLVRSLRTSCRALKPGTGEIWKPLQRSFTFLSFRPMATILARRSRTRWAVQSSLMMCAALRPQSWPKERPQTEGQLGTCTQGLRVLLATELCLRVPLEKCRPIVSMRLPFPFLASEVRSPEAPNKH